MFLNYLFYIALSLVSSDYQEEKPEKENIVTLRPEGRLQYGDDIIA